MAPSHLLWPFAREHLLLRLMETHVLVAAPRCSVSPGNTVVGFPITYGYWVTIAKCRGARLD